MKTPAQARRIFAALEKHHPGADTELVHRNAFELLVATILSAQSTDRRVNEVTPTAGSTGVRYVRFTMLSNQTPDFATTCPDGPYSGCSFTDLTEIEVFGTPAA